MGGRECLHPRRRGVSADDVLYDDVPAAVRHQNPDRRAAQTRRLVGAREGTAFGQKGRRRAAGCTERDDEEVRETRAALLGCPFLSAMTRTGQETNRTGFTRSGAKSLS